MPPKGYKMSPEAKKKIAEGRTGKKHTPETRAKIAASHVGKKRPPEVCAAIGAGRLGSRFSEESKKRLSEVHMGHHMPDSAREALMKYKNHSGRKVIINGVLYNSMAKAAIALKIPYQDVVVMCRYRPQLAELHGLTIDWVEPKGDEL